MFSRSYKMVNTLADLKVKDMDTLKHAISKLDVDQLMDLQYNCSLVTYIVLRRLKKELDLSKCSIASTPP
jgi:hypothetical protein